MTRRSGHHTPVAGGKPRQIALDTLLRSQRQQAAAERLLADTFREAKLSSADAGLARELVSGCVRWRRLLDWLIERATDGREQKPAVQEILRLGLYQIFFLNRIPDHAIADESVRLAKRNKCVGQAGFINAIIRRFLREKETIFRDISTIQEDRPALGQSHPDWLFDNWEQRWGREKTIRLLEWNNQPAPTYARLNRLKTNAETLAKRWDEEQVEATAFDCDWAPANTVYRLRSHPPIESVPSFRDGLFYIQDPSTLLSVDLLDPKPSQAVLDLCAAPGGKTGLIAERMNNEGQLTATDTSDSRLGLLRENCERLGVTCAALGQAEAVLADTTPRFDQALVDVPCSNTGVMRRRLDLRWRITPEETRYLTDTQLRLLARATGFVRPGGALVYSTCSIEPEENEQIVKRFLEENTGWQLETEHTLHPVEDHTDGAYAARLTKD